MNGELPSVTEILRGEGATLPYGATAMAETGFGSYFHMRDLASNPVLPPADDATEFEDDGQQHVRYI